MHLNVNSKGVIEKELLQDFRGSQIWAHTHIGYQGLPETHRLGNVQVEYNYKKKAFQGFWEGIFPVDFKYLYDSDKRSIIGKAIDAEIERAVEVLNMQLK